ncbi:hypothetical protein E2562_010806 [Oryza meyeriana var. granulata]|uniref:Uncharacterized protein n=1 Tax=Oryza meyeriana var. granulata TaxID=110450 RepID=A0A6G1BJ67_9ORYZ|nr:hypothetical protein E2562_010806 [Oryza meyeriana var. granulata]
MERQYVHLLVASVKFRSKTTNGTRVSTHHSHLLLLPLSGKHLILVGQVRGRECTNAMGMGEVVAMRYRAVGWRPAGGIPDPIGSSGKAGRHHQIGTEEHRQNGDSAAVKTESG